MAADTAQMHIPGGVAAVATGQINEHWDGSRHRYAILAGFGSRNRSDQRPLRWQQTQIHNPGCLRQPQQVRSTITEMAKDTDTQPWLVLAAATGPINDH